ncbi:MAG: hypothetical protein ACJA2F_000378 [Nitriliruptoraceae bacterium]
MRIPLLRAATAITAVLAIAAVPSVPTSSPQADDLAPVLDAIGRCDPTDASRCLLPFPNDLFTIIDGRTATGVRVNLPAEGMPRSVGAKPMDPSEWNRNDGWSPGSPVLTFIDDLDLEGSFDTDRPMLETPALSLATDAPIVIVDADTGERHPYFAELDTHRLTTDGERTLIIRPLVNFTEGHRYVIGLRDMVRNDGSTVVAGEAFAAIRSADLTDAAATSAEGRYRRIFADLAEAGVDRDELVLAWDFTIASAQGLAGRMLSIRDQSFAMLGDTDLANLTVEGDAPGYQITNVEQIDSADTAYRITGTVDVPNFLTLPQDTASSAGFEYPDLPGAGDIYAQNVPGSRFYYGPNNASPSPTDLPMVNPAAPVFTAEFVCNVPASVSDGETARPMLYGHGLLGSKRESQGGSVARMRERGFMPCGVDWAGMATEDVANVATILGDMGNFPSLADRTQQGMLNFLLVGRALVHPDGFASDPAFQREDGTSVFGGELVYDGNSQGAIIGGALAAVAPDFTKATVGVAGMNYSTLLNRSVDWEGSYGDIMYAFYPDKIDQQLVLALVQQIWDRSETNGYAAHATSDPYPNTPAHQVLIHVALGDYQVANVSAEVQARTMGADLLTTALAPGRHWADGSSQRTFGFNGFSDGVAASGSAFVYFDSGNPLPPSGNTPPLDVGQDPHSDPRKDANGADQKGEFFATGIIRDARNGATYWTPQCPRNSEQNPGC